MSRARATIDGIKTFWSEVVIETQKCEWPSRQALTESTVVVIVSMFLMAAFIGGSDRLLVNILKWLIQAK